jgi:hypothetical protein
MTEIVAPDSNTPIVDSEGKMDHIYYRWVVQMTSLDLIVGTGTPEGSIEATVGRAYMDDAGSTGSLLYMKKLADIGGDRTQGWVVV